jgi:hypothetical protein
MGDRGTGNLEGLFHPCPTPHPCHTPLFPSPEVRWPAALCTCGYVFPSWWTKCIWGISQNKCFWSCFSLSISRHNYDNETNKVYTYINTHRCMPPNYHKEIILDLILTHTLTHTQYAAEGNGTVICWPWGPFTGSNQSYLWLHPAFQEDTGWCPSSKEWMHLKRMCCWLWATEAADKHGCTLDSGHPGLSCSKALNYNSFPRGNPERKNNPGWSHGPGLSSSAFVPTSKHLDADGNWLISIRSSFPLLSKRWLLGPQPQQVKANLWPQNTAGVLHTNSCSWVQGRRARKSVRWPKTQVCYRQKVRDSL